MESIIITPKNKEQADEIKAMLEKTGVEIGILTEEEKEDAGLLLAMKEGEKDKGEVKLSTFLKNLRE
jgi:hypothetical protein